MVAVAHVLMCGGSGLLGMQVVEQLGRKPTLLVTGTLYAAGFGAMATCSGYYELLAGRLLTGLGGSTEGAGARRQMEGVGAAVEEGMRCGGRARVAARQWAVE